MKNKKIIPNLLDKLISLNYKISLKEKNEESFNIFKALHKENDEVRLHSRFISVLLSPNSSHNKKTLFLEKFLNLNDIKEFELDQVEVIPNEIIKSEYKNIDILIINRISSQAIIIENKIYAHDSNNEDTGQLERYYELVKDEQIKEENIYVYYLSIDGREPSDESYGKNIELKNKTRIIDYEHNIKAWLNSCLQNCINEPFLRESITQYINLIDDMTHNTDVTDRLEIIDLISQSESDLKATKLLFDNYKHIKWHTVRNFWNELEGKLKEFNYEITNKPSDQNITSTTHFAFYKHGYSNANDYGIYFRKDDKKFFIWNSTEGLYWGIYKIDFDKYNLELKYFQDFELFNGYFRKYFLTDNSSRIDLTDFYNLETFKLIMQKERQSVVQRILNEVNKYLKDI